MIGILGGTFDPVHNGHLHIASRVVEILDLHQLLFMPAGLPVHRRGPQASAQQRCEMIALAIEDCERFALSRVEVERARPSYSIDTVCELKRRTDYPLLLVLGSDAFNGFAQWKQPERILELANLVVCRRPGARLDSNVFASHRVESREALSRADSGAILALEVEANSCSSTEVRRQAAAGTLGLECVPARVGQFIREHSLYGATRA